MSKLQGTNGGLWGTRACSMDRGEPASHCHYYLLPAAVTLACNLLLPREKHHDIPNPHPVWNISLRFLGGLGLAWVPVSPGILRVGRDSLIPNLVPREEYRNVNLVRMVE